MPGVTDLDILEASLEAAAELAEDLTDPVYEKFFERCPEAQPLFRLDRRTRGRMLNEVIKILTELAVDHEYMPATIDVLAKDHASYGNIPITYYRGLLDALTSVLAELLGGAWTVEYEQAWRNQIGHLLRLVEASMAQPLDVSPPDLTPA